MNIIKFGMSLIFAFIISTNIIAEDVFAPTKDEFGLIGKEVFVIKRKSGNDVVSSYHKWHDLSSEHRLFRVVGDNKEVIYRAIALSIPLHLGANGDSMTEAPYNGYVVGTVNGAGAMTRVLPMSKVEWIISNNGK